MDSRRVMVRPVVTEKNTLLAEHGKYGFEVAGSANKVEVRQAVEELFKVKVAKVNMVRVPGKKRHFGRRQGATRSWKKALVTLQPGHRIELFEGV